METITGISEDTQATLLLCGSLGGHSSVRPLTAPQYRDFVAALIKLGKRPSDLLSDEGLADEICAVQEVNKRVREPATPERVRELMHRGVSLSVSVDKWNARGVRVVGKTDAAYPRRLRDHLGGQAPSIVYYAGDETLFAGGGMAFVGARDIAEEARDAVCRVVRGCVDLGMTVVSGGARGADRASMVEALECGGRVIGVLHSDLLKTCVEPECRDALSSGRVLLFSVVDPEAKFSGAAAMDRNKYIYGMADACFVAQSDIGSHSGTWSGATEELKRKNHHPVFVYMASTPSKGCVDLLKFGAKAWNMEKDVAANLESGRTAASQKVDYDGDLFSGYSAAEPKAEYRPEVRAETGANTGEMAKDPYGLFVEALKDFLQTKRKEADAKKRLQSKLDLVSAQVKHWLERAKGEGICVAREYPAGGKGKVCVMLELSSQSE